jgi:hypothetical protein
MKLIALDNNNQPFWEQELLDRNFLVMAAGKIGADYFRENLNFVRIDGKHVLDEQYRDIAQTLTEDYSQHLASAFPGQTLFVVDEDWEPSEKSNANTIGSKISISRASADLRMITGYEYVIRMKQYWINEWTNAQLAAAIFSQLARVNAVDGSIANYTAEYTSNLVATFGAGYLEPGAEIPNLLDGHISIHGMKTAPNSQVSMDEMIVEGKGDAE